MTVNCPQCHTANPTGSQLCDKCGAKLVIPDGITAAPTISGPPRPEELNTGTILNAKYRILGKIGSGGMGVVYKAEDLRLKRTVALKFLSSKLTNWEAHERFVHEAQAASELDHPNICTVYEFDETEAGQMYIAMAYYSGESLRDKIKRGPLTVEEALDNILAERNRYYQIVDRESLRVVKEGLAIFKNFVPETGETSFGSAAS